MQQCTPAKLVDNGSDGERPDHASHAENGHGEAPHHDVGLLAERLPVPLHRHILEEPAQFLPRGGNTVARLDNLATGGRCGVLQYRLAVSNGVRRTENVTSDTITPQ